MNALQESMAYALGALLFAYMWVCFKTSRVHCTEEAEEAFSSSCDIGVPSTFVFWHDEYLLVSLASFWPRIPMPTIVMGEQFGGRVSAYFARLRGTGVEVLSNRRNSREKRIAQLIAALKNKRWMGIAADYGRPWFSARPTALQMAEATGGLVVPIHIESTRSLQLGFRGWKVTIPLPFTNITVRSCPPLQPKSSDNDTSGWESGSKISLTLNRLRANLSPHSQKLQG